MEKLFGLPLSVAEWPANIRREFRAGVRRFPGSELFEKGEISKRFNHPPFRVLLDLAVKKATMKEAISLLQLHDLAGYLSKEKMLIRYFARRFAPPPTQRFGARDVLVKPIREASLKAMTQVLVGKSGLGKTEYAISHFKNPLHVSHKDDLSKLNSGDFDGVIRDDFGVSAFEPEELIRFLGVERETTRDIKFSSVVIPEGMPRFIICNDMSAFWPKMIEGHHKDSCKRRMVVREVKERLFKKPAIPLAHEDPVISDPRFEAWSCDEDSGHGDEGGEGLCEQPSSSNAGSSGVAIPSTSSSSCLPVPLSERPSGSDVVRAEQLLHNTREFSDGVHSTPPAFAGQVKFLEVAFGDELELLDAIEYEDIVVPVDLSMKRKPEDAEEGKGKGKGKKSKL